MYGVHRVQTSAKAFIVTLISAMTFALGAAPSYAAPEAESFALTPAAAPAAANAQRLNTDLGTSENAPLDTLLLLSDATENPPAALPHNFDVEATIALAESEVGTSRATGWSQPGECIMSAQRWIRAGGGAWAGGGDPVTNYNGATRLPVSAALPGDIIQYEHLTSPSSWVSGVHTVLITGVNSDGTFSIIESNNPGGSGLVSKNESWVPAPPSGFQAVAWRF